MKFISFRIFVVATFVFLANCSFAQTPILSEVKATLVPEFVNGSPYLSIKIKAPDWKVGNILHIEVLKEESTVLMMTLATVSEDNGVKVVYLSTSEKKFNIINGTAAIEVPIDETQQKFAKSLSVFMWDFSGQKSSNVNCEIK
ncbi:MAG: hypothetical protein ACK40G_01085 [Cytophagaceae bacterium]